MRQTVGREGLRALFVPSSPQKSNQIHSTLRSHTHTYIYSNPNACAPARAAGRSGGGSAGAGSPPAHFFEAFISWEKMKEGRKVGETQIESEDDAPIQITSNTPHTNFTCSACTRLASSSACARCRRRHSRADSRFFCRRRRFLSCWCPPLSYLVCCERVEPVSRSTQ